MQIETNPNILPFMLRINIRLQFFIAKKGFRTFLKELHLSEFFLPGFRSTSTYSQLSVRKQRTYWRGKNSC